MKIIQIRGETGVAEVSGIRREISLALLEKPKINDWVMIHAGFAIAKLKAKEAKKTLTILAESGMTG